MKNIIIVGASRSGKTTLAKRIMQKYNISHYPFDALVSTMEELYPETGIKHLDENKQMSQNIAKFMKTFMKHMDYEDMNYVIDLYQIYPDDLVPILDRNTITLYLGYPNVSPVDKLNQIKQHAREQDWTNDVSDQEMLGIIKLFIAENKVMNEQCTQHGISFFDTSQDFIGALNKAEEYIDKELKT